MFETQKGDSRNGNFVDLVSKDIKELNIDLSEVEIKSMNKIMWKIFVDRKIKEADLKHLNEENSKMKKTKHISFEQFKMIDYLFQKKNVNNKDNIWYKIRNTGY